MSNIFDPVLFDIKKGTVKSSSDGERCKKSSDKGNHKNSSEGSDYEYFEKKIDEHFYREMEIMKEMFESDLSQKEWIELRIFISNHPHHKLVNFLRGLKNVKQRKS